jgi:hypothetical protein
MEEQNGKDIELVFTHSQQVKDGIQEAGFGGDQVEKFVAKLDNLLNWFKQYEVDSIELSIEGGVTSGPVLQLFVSAEGKAGCTITLKPKKIATTISNNLEKST